MFLGVWLTTAGARRAAGCLFACAAAVLAAMPPARADLAINMVIVDFADAKRRSADVELENKGKERLYVVAEPARIEQPGTAKERRVTEADPEKLGLLVSPTRLVLEPGERKLVRFLVMGEIAEEERIYRITIKPVVGKVTAPQSAVKVVVGYDLLVMVRPAQPRLELTAQRQGAFLVFRNAGNSNVLLFDGKQCSGRCRPLETKRIYAGGEWRLRLTGSGSVTYKVQSAGKIEQRSF